MNTFPVDVISRAEEVRARFRDLDWACYEDFSAGSLSEERWTFREAKAPDGSSWRYEEPNARFVFRDGAMEVSVARFERSHDTVQNFDNAKFLVLSSSTFSVPEDGYLAVAARLAAEKSGGGAEDFRDGVVSLNVVEFATGLVFDVLATGERHGAIYERMPHTEPWSFLHVVDAPFHSPPTSPGRWHDVAVLIDAERRCAHWLVDDRLIHSAMGLEIVPSSVRIGMGLMTIRPLSQQGSVSLRGQGMTGRWGDIRIGVSSSGKRR